MAAALEDVLGDRLDDGFVVVKDGYAVPTRRITLVEAGHPGARRARRGGGARASWNARIAPASTTSCSS